MDAHQIEQETTRYLTAILQRFYMRHPSLTFTGLACECDPSVGSLYVYLRDANYREHKSPDYWPYHMIEQEFDSIPTPTWFEQYDDLQNHYFLEDAGDYLELEAALSTVLLGVSSTVAKLQREGQLQRWGFADDPELIVFTEDDDDEVVGHQRVREQLART